MAYPLMEHLTGETFYYNGSIYKSTDSLAEELSGPSDLRTYYETLRIMEGVLLYAEDHMDRLSKSVASLEDFPVDIEGILDSAKTFIEDSGINSGNIRIVLTKSQLLIHEVDIKLPTEDMFRNGINTSLLKWERQTPNVKVFRGDYKNTVNKKFTEENEHGLPFELVLADNEDRIYEGSMSNLFVIKDGKVYSAPDSKILIGITRRRVIEALRRAGTELTEGMFKLEDLKGTDCAVFVSSTPFDILPVRYIDGYSFDSADNGLLQMIAREYKAYTAEYIAAHK
ncbi:MAG: aminotransferase class IV [Clostridiales bacterium]|nr:aminotransferase class IV [Clostridiales bacterium]